MPGGGREGRAQGSVQGDQRALRLGATTAPACSGVTGGTLVSLAASALQVVVIDTLREPVAKVLSSVAFGLVCQASTSQLDDYLGTGAQASDDEEMLLGSGQKPETSGGPLS